MGGTVAPVSNPLDRDNERKKATVLNESAPVLIPRDIRSHAIPRSLDPTILPVSRAPTRDHAVGAIAKESIPPGTAPLFARVKRDDDALLRNVQAIDMRLIERFWERINERCNFKSNMLFLVAF